jgi:Leucine-rich repeat (LRR) protein
MVYLQGLTKLNFLDLSDNQITDTGFEHLKLFTQLQGVELHHNQITGSSFKKLKPWSLLDHIDISHDPVEDAEFASFIKSLNLNYLRAANTNVGDISMKYIGKMTELIDLRLDETLVTNDGVLQLVALGKLRTLGLAGTEIDDRRTKIQRFQFYPSTKR